MEDFEQKRRAYLERFLSDKRLQEKASHMELKEKLKLYDPRDEFELSIADSLVRLAQVALDIRDKGSGMSEDDINNSTFKEFYSRLVKSKISRKKNDFNLILDELAKPDIYAQVYYEWVSIALLGELENVMINIAYENGFDPYDDKSVNKFTKIWNLIWKKADLGNLSLILFNGENIGEEDFEKINTFLEHLKQIYDKNHSYGTR